MTSGYPRTNCCVAGCKRGTTTIEPVPAGHVSIDSGRGRHEWICPVHWRVVPRAWKRRRRKIRKWLNRTWPNGMDWQELTEEQQRQHRVAMRLAQKVWRRMKTYAANPLDLKTDDALVDALRRMALV